MVAIFYPYIWVIKRFVSLSATEAGLCHSKEQCAAVHGVVTGWIGGRRRRTVASCSPFYFGFFIVRRFYFSYFYCILVPFKFSHNMQIGEYNNLLVGFSKGFFDHTFAHICICFRCFFHQNVCLILNNIAFNKINCI